MIHHADDRSVRMMLCPICGKAHPVTMAFTRQETGVICGCEHLLTCVGATRDPQGQVYIIIEAVKMDGWNYDPAMMN